MTEREPLPAVEPGYWTLAQLAVFLGCSRWTIARRVKADPAFPVASEAPA